MVIANTVFKKPNIYNICPSAFWQIPNASRPSQDIAEGLSMYRNLVKDLLCVISRSADDYILKLFCFMKNLNFQCKKKILSVRIVWLHEIRFSKSFKRGK